MTYATRWIKSAQTVFLALAIMGAALTAQAADLPLAAASPMTGVAFDDQPLLLPVQRNFQMALLTASSELGRTCGRMEAYGWRMNQNEQNRVNQIFNNTVDRLRLLGYSITPQSLTSISKDITLFTTDRGNKHFIFLWSAGDLGLVLNVCESTAPVNYRPTPLTPSVQVFPVPMDVVGGHLDTINGGRKSDINNFTPVGIWNGSYSCAQGYTGGTLQISHLQGKDFEGVFKFYPTDRNPSVSAGSYTVYGQYDRESKRILINPGQWIKHPHDYYNTVIVGSFDTAKDTFSAYFQGITGCTSFEAARSDAAPSEYVAKKVAPKKAAVKKKKAVKKAPAKSTVKAMEPAATVTVPTSVTPDQATPAAAPTTEAPAANPVAPVQPAAPTSPSSDAAPSQGAPSGVVPVTGATTSPVPLTASQAPTQAVTPVQAGTSQETALPDDKKGTAGNGILLSAPTSSGQSH